MITQSELKEIFDYKDGQLIWKKSKRKNKNGLCAGGIGNHGYITTTVNNIPYRIHRLIYIYHFGNIPDNLVIDHIDNNRLNNHIENLRLVTVQQNTFNNSKAKGYYFSKQRNKFRAYIMFNGEVKHLGYFENERDAREAYLKTKEKVHTFDNSPDITYMIPDKPKCYSFRKNINKFRVRMTINGKRKQIGDFNTELEAIEAVNNIRTKLLNKEVDNG